jgi:hypothetical protein
MFVYNNVNVRLCVIVQRGRRECGRLCELGGLCKDAKAGESLDDADGVAVDACGLELTDGEDEAGRAGVEDGDSGAGCPGRERVDGRGAVDDSEAGARVEAVRDSGARKDGRDGRQ